MSLAAGSVAGAEGHREGDPARVQAVHAQHAQAGADARACSGAPVKNDVKLNVVRASFEWF